MSMDSGLSPSSAAALLGNPGGGAPPLSNLGFFPPMKRVEFTRVKSSQQSWAHSEHED